MRHGSIITVVIFQLAAPALVCRTNLTVAANATVGLPDPGWCRTPKPRDSCPEWTYADPHDRHTAVQEWNLCDRQSVLLFAQTSAILSFGVGGFIAANLADRFGRIRMYIVYLVVDAVCSVTKSFSVNVWMFIATHAVHNAILCCCVTAFYTVLNEVVHPKQRRYFEFVSFITFSIGHCVNSGVAFVTPSWRDLERAQLVLIAGALLMIAVAVRESPKWLLVVGRQKRAVEVLKHMAAMNRRPPIPDKSLVNMSIAVETTRAGPLDLFASRQLVKNAAATTIVTTLAIMVYFLITWNSDTFLQGSIYINVIIMGVTEMPNSFLFLLLVKFFSKKWLIMAALILCGSTLMLGATITAVSSAVVASKICIFLSRMAANFSHNALYSFVPEVFPTSLRSFGLGLANLGSRLVAAPMPYLLLTAHEDDILIPSLVMGGMVILGTLTLICLPDTFACRLPDTVEEARMFKRGSEHLFRIDQKALVRIEEETTRQLV